MAKAYRARMTDLQQLPSNSPAALRRVGLNARRRPRQSFGKSGDYAVELCAALSPVAVSPQAYNFKS
jgi:hypothetical protein